jgi:4-hydroxy-tetrahydrodipicolinate synthase
MTYHELAQPLRGIIPPMITPLAGPDRLDVAGLERLVEHLVAGGVHGVFILGTTGEGPSHGYRLRRELIDHGCRLFDRRIPVLVGVTDTSLVESIRLAEHAADAGADAIVFAPPYYVPPSQDELVAYSRELIAASPLPVVLYNMPALTKVAFAPESVARLRDEAKVVGIKDSSGDIDYFRQLVEVARQRDDWTVLVGAEHLLAESVAIGGDGCVAGGANVWPGLFVAIYDAAVANDEPRLRRLAPKLVEYAKLYAIGGNSIAAIIGGIKTAVEELGICHAIAAPPLAALASQQRKQVQALLAELDLAPIQAAAAG